MKIVWFKDTDDNILNIVSKSGASHSSYSSPLNPGAGEKVNEKGNLDMLVTLDGFFEYSNNELRSMDAILYGRMAYQKTGHQNVDELGPETESTIEFVNNVNNIKKVVFSRTLEKVEDNAILIKENIEDEVSKMKQMPGKDLMLVCGPELVSTFIQLSLIDQYRIGVVPIILGEGKSLFKDVKDRLNLKLIKTEIFNSGLVMLHYQLIK